MSYIYRIKNISSLDLEKIKKLDGVEGAEIDGNNLIIEGSVKPEAIEKNIDSPDKYETYRIHATIDCADCARKVEEGLLKNKGVASSSFNFSKGVLTVTTLLSKEEIKEVARKIEDDISFFDEEFIKYTFNVSIDCAECARKVEEALNKNDKVKKAIFNYPKGKLIVEALLKEDEIKQICREVEDEIVFIEPIKKYVFSLTVKSKDAAKKIEEGLLTNESIQKVRLDYKKQKLYVSSVLREDEVRTLVLSLDSSIIFHTSTLEKEKDYTPYRIVVSLILLLISFVFKNPYISILSYLVSGYDVIWKAIKNISKGKVFDENFLMTVATIAALAIRSYKEAASVMIFYQIGEFFQNLAVGTSRDSIGKLLDLSSDYATVKRNNEWKEERVENIEVGDTLLLKSGEKLAIDGIVTEGESYINTAALTGESVPVKVKEGSTILSGSVNGDTSLIIKATKRYSDSTLSKIMKLVEDSETKKAQSEKFISRFSLYYTPFVCISALLVALIPPLFGLTEWKDSIYRAAMLLVISCPCALVLSVPLTYFAAMGSYAKRGILVKGDDAIQKLAHIAIVATDKTGTITEGVFSVQNIKKLTQDDDHLLDIIYSLERESTHPIASALVKYTGERNVKAQNVHTINGIGIEGVLDNKKIAIGNSKITNEKIDIDTDGTLVYVTEEGKTLAVIAISDKIRSNAKETMLSLRKEGVKTIALISGDRKERVEKTARDLNIDEYYYELLPLDKLNILDSLKKKGRLVYVGDGINDSPSLKSADCGIAMGGVGSDSAIEASDCVIMDDDISRIPIAIKIAKKTEKIVKENIAFSLIIKFVVFILAIFGLANMWYAVFADTGVSLLAVANALRALKYKKDNN